MTEQPKSKNLKRGISALILLFALSCWSFYEFSENYSKVEKSNQMVLSLLDTQTQLTAEYKKEMALFKDGLEQTEVLLSKVQLENKKLQEKIKLLDKVAELEETISRLKEKNAHLINVMSAKQPEKPAFSGKDIKTLKEGQTALLKINERVQQLRDDFRAEELVKRLAAQRERDRIKSLMGNNGYLVRNGKILPVAIPPIPPEKKVSIEVEIVK